MVSYYEYCENCHTETPHSFLWRTTSIWAFRCRLCSHRKIVKSTAPNHEFQVQKLTDKCRNFKNCRFAMEKKRCALISGYYKCELH